MTDLASICVTGLFLYVLPIVHIIKLIIVLSYSFFPVSSSLEFGLIVCLCVCCECETDA